METDQLHRLAPVLGAVPAAGEEDDHRRAALQLGKLAALAGLIGQLVIREDRAGDDIGTHGDLAIGHSLYIQGLLGPTRFRSYQRGPTSPARLVRVVQLVPRPAMIEAARASQAAARAAAEDPPRRPRRRRHPHRRAPLLRRRGRDDEGLRRPRWARPAPAPALRRREAGGAHRPARRAGHAALPRALHRAGGGPQPRQGPRHRGNCAKCANSPRRDGVHGRRRQRPPRAAQGGPLLRAGRRGEGSAARGPLGLAARRRPRRGARAVRDPPRREGVVAAARGMKRLRREVRVRALLLAMPLMRVLPASIGAALGWLAWYLVPRQRRLARAHLAIAFPEKPAGERDRIRRKSFANLRRRAFETAPGDARRLPLAPGAQALPLT